MINLVRADFKRIRSRRAVVGVALGVLALLFLVDGLQHANAKPRHRVLAQTVYLSVPPPAECVLEREPRLAVSEACLGGYEYVAPFIDGPEPTGTEADLYRFTGAKPLETELRTSIGGWGIGLSLASLIIASTFIGGDFGTSLVGQMLFEPRRGRVYASKAIAAVLACAALTLGVLALDAVFKYITASSVDSVGNLDGSWYAHRLLDVARVLGCVAAAALTGFGFTMLLRRTAASLGIYFGSAIALQFITATDTFRPFAKLIPLNAVIFVAMWPSGRPDDQAPFQSNGVAAAFLIGWCVVATIVGLGTFARREVR